MVVVFCKGFLIHLRDTAIIASRGREHISETGIINSWLASVDTISVSTTHIESATQTEYQVRSIPL